MSHQWKKVLTTSLWNFVSLNQHMLIYLGEIASTFNEMCVQREVDPKEVLQDMLLDLTDNKIQRRKLKTALPSLKPATPKELSSRVIYQFTCSSWNACYVGQTSRHLKTRVNEHLKEKAPVGQHLRTCGSLQSYDLKIIDKHFNVSTLVTLESLYIAMLRPEINGKEEYTSRPLTVKLWVLTTLVNSEASPRNYR